MSWSNTVGIQRRGGSGMVTSKNKQSLRLGSHKEITDCALELSDGL